MPPFTPPTQWLAGRFITRDPIKDGRNWYAYCENNPVNAIDADGLTPVQVTKKSKYYEIILKAILLIAELDPEMGKKLMNDLEKGQIYVDVDEKSDYGNVDWNGSRILLGDFMLNFASGGDGFFAQLVATLLHEGRHKHYQSKISDPLDRELDANEYTIRMLHAWLEKELAKGVSTLGVKILEQIDVEGDLQRKNQRKKLGGGGRRMKFEISSPSMR